MWRKQIWVRENIDMETTAVTYCKVLRNMRFQILKPKEIDLELFLEVTGHYTWFTVKRRCGRKQICVRENLDMESTAVTYCKVLRKMRFQILKPKKVDLELFLEVTGHFTWFTVKRWCGRKQIFVRENLDMESTSVHIAKCSEKCVFKY